MAEQSSESVDKAVDTTVRAAPKSRPARGLISPVTMGRLSVRFMSASMSRS